MPRSKRRPAAEMGPDEDDRCTSKRVRNTLSSARRYNKADQSNSTSFSGRKCSSWFFTYTSVEDPKTLGPEEMEQFCQDLGVEPEDIIMLVLAWKMNARQMGYFTLDEWLTGFTDLQCDSVQKLQNKFDYLKSLLNDSTQFKSIYRYAYDFARDKDQRSMDLETAKLMLELLLAKQWSLFGDFIKFLNQSKYKVINKDQWCNILEFSRTIRSDLSNYDVDGAWPVMLDEFVEWIKIPKNEEELVQS